MPAVRSEVSRNAGAARRGRGGAGEGGIPAGQRAWSGVLQAAVEAIATEEHNSPARRGHWIERRRKVALRAVVETAAGSGAAPWESIELEIVRVLEAMNDLRESLDYELHRLTERSPEFFDETVGRHLESLERELAALQTQAEALAGEIEELTGEREELGD